MKKNFDKLIRIALLAPFVAEMVIHGSTKPAPVVGTITYLRTEADVQYIYDAGSFVSNDLVHVAFTFAVAPGTADFQLWAWPRSSTNEEEMVLVYSNTLAGVAQPYEFEYAGAISNRWFGFTTWTPGPSVHTNGVALVNWQLPYDPAATNIAAMTRTGVYFDDVRLAPNVFPLPYDAEVEYLESTGTQYIDTEMRLSSTGFEYGLDVDIRDAVLSQIFGGRTQANATSTDSLSLFVMNANGFRCDHLGASTGVGVSTPGRKIIYYANSTTTINGNIYNTPIGPDGRTSGSTVYLFAGHRPDTVEHTSRVRIYSLEFYQDRVLILDFVPVRVGAGTNAVGYMYDRVSGRLFGNAGTGAFIIGPDK